MHTTTNANSVPMLVISPTTWIGTSPATMATITQVMIVVMYGVWKPGCTLLTPSAEVRRGSLRRRYAADSSASRAARS